MATPAKDNDSNEEKKQNKSESSKLNDTLNRIDNMEENFQSLKDGFTENIQELGNKINDAAQTHGLPPPPTTTAASENDYYENDDNKDEVSAETTKKMSAIFGGIKKFDKDKLKETETVIKHIIRVTDYTAHHDPEEVKEYYTQPFLVKKLAERFGQMLLHSKHTVFHTGAGVSTAAKLPDYRGPQGVWTLRAQGLEPQFEITLEQAQPTYSHMAMMELFKNNLLHYLVSTNVDGLHRRSGIKKSQMAELHGNIYREYCEDCGAEYLRAFDTTKNCINRRTGRLCNDTECNGKLRDSIINFGELLPETELNNAIQQTSKADLCVVFGSSLRVQPACDIPLKAWSMNKGKLVICNLQQTNYDDYCELSGGFRIGAKIDEFMKLVMDNLKIKVNQFNTDKVFLIELKDEIKNLRVDPEFGKYKYNIIKNDAKSKLYSSMQNDVDKK